MNALNYTTTNYKTDEEFARKVAAKERGLIVRWLRAQAKRIMRSASTKADDEARSCDGCAAGELVSAAIRIANKEHRRG